MAGDENGAEASTSFGFKGQALSAAQSNDQIAAAQRAARDLQAKVNKMRDPAERQRMIQEAYDREVTLHGESKFAKRLQSGAWQGAAGGVGIGGGVAMGLGATVGTLVGGVVALPTTALGGIIGTGVGALHGPWFTLKKGENKEKQGDPSPEQAQISQEAFDRGEQHLQEERLQIQKSFQSTELREGEKRRPRKLETRKPSNAAIPSVTSLAASDGDTQAQSRRKPRKLEVRSSRAKGDG